jgi:hypothetical protein
MNLSDDAQVAGRPACTLMAATPADRGDDPNPVLKL